MPVYPGTNVRAELIVGGITETVSRMNPGRIFEGYMGAANRDNRLRLINHFHSKYGSNYLNKINLEDIYFVRDFLKGYYSMINPRMVNYLMSFNDTQLENHVYEVLEEALYMEFPTDNIYNVMDVIECIDQTSYAPYYDNISYIRLGRKVTSDQPVRICRSYFMLLDRTARDFLAVSSSKVNAYLMPVKGSSSRKHEHQHAQTPITSLSETETAILAGFSPELLAEVYDLSLNSHSHRELSRNILEEGGKFNKGFDIDRQAIPYGGSMPLKLLKHTFRCAGIVFEYSDDDEAISVDMSEGVH